MATDMSASTSRHELDEWMLVDNADESHDTSAASVVERGDAQQEETSTTAKIDETRKEHAIPDGCVGVRLRHGEDLRPAFFRPTQRVDEFLANFFADVLKEGKRVRLIYMGMLMAPERTMGEYGVEEDSVIHAVINSSVPTPHEEKLQEAPLKGLATPANTLLVSTGFVLYGLWTVHYYYPQFFSWKATILLGTLSVAHVSATVSRIVH